MASEGHEFGPGTTFGPVSAHIEIYEWSHTEHVEFDNCDCLYISRDNGLHHGRIHRQLGQCVRCSKQRPSTLRQVRTMRDILRGKGISKSSERIVTRSKPVCFNGVSEDVRIKASSRRRLHAHDLTSNDLECSRIQFSAKVTHLDKRQVHIPENEFPLQLSITPSTP